MLFTPILSEDYLVKPSISNIHEDCSILEKRLQKYLSIPNENKDGDIEVAGAITCRGTIKLLSNGFYIYSEAQKHKLLPAKESMCQQYICSIEKSLLELQCIDGLLKLTEFGLYIGWTNTFITTNPAFKNYNTNESKNDIKLLLKLLRYLITTNDKTNEFGLVIFQYVCSILAMLSLIMSINAIKKDIKLIPDIILPIK